MKTPLATLAILLLTILAPLTPSLADDEAEARKMILDIHRTLQVFEYWPSLGIVDIRDPNFSNKAQALEQALIMLRALADQYPTTDIGMALNMNSHAYNLSFKFLEDQIHLLTLMRTQQECLYEHRQPDDPECLDYLSDMVADWTRKGDIDHALQTLQNLPPAPEPCKPYDTFRFTLNDGQHVKPYTPDYLHLLHRALTIALTKECTPDSLTDTRLYHDYRTAIDAAIRNNDMQTARHYTEHSPIDQWRTEFNQMIENATAQ